MLASFVLFLVICVLDSKAHDPADIWGGSRVFLVTDLRNSTVDVEKLYTSFTDRGLADVFNRLVIVQRGQNGRFINSHGSFRALSRVQDRTFWYISKKEILPWLLEEKANVIICVADNTDVPQILISAQRKGLLPLDTKLMIWMIQGDIIAADGVNKISLTSPEDFDPWSSRLDALRDVHFISERNLESKVIELFQSEKGFVPHRERRGAVVQSSTKREPLPSSSRVVVTEQPPVYQNETIVVVFEGNCSDIVGINEKEGKFRKAFKNEVAEKLNIPESAVAISDVACGSVRVTFTLVTVTSANVSQVLKKLVESGNISVTVDNKTFTASKLEVVRPTKPSTMAPTTEAKKNEIAFILYIAFGSLMAFIFIVGIIVLIVRCRRDRREGSFYLTNETNYELSRFQGVPRANSYSRVNYYGEPVEMDATAPDPNADDEFQPGAGAHPYDRAPTSGRGKPTAAANGDAKEEKFNVGAMGMPEWKNLPKLSQKEITVAEPKEGIPKSSGSVGSRELLLDDDSPPADSTYAYDNPVITFGDGPTGLDKEDS